MIEKLCATISGGRTSGMMAKIVRDELEKNYEETHYVFANTGREHEETLQFVRDIGLNFDIKIVWLESVFSPVFGVGPSFKIVNFETAARNWEPF